MKSIHKILVIMMSVSALCLGMASAQSVSANESLNISVKGVPAAEQSRVSGVYNVSPSGTLSLPMLKNEFKASGLSASTLARRIEAAYKAAGIYKDPRITILSMADNNAQVARQREVVNVGGKVKSAGPKPFIQGMTLFSAVSAAGGADPFGAMNRVELFHNGRRKIYNLKTAAHMNIRVYPGDSINVPQKNAWGK